MTPPESKQSKEKKGTIIIGLGNPILSDDSVGVKAARRLADVLKDRNDVEVIEVYAGGLRLMDVLIGYQKAVIIDAMQTGAPVGTVRRFSLSELPKTRNLSSTHDVDLPTALETGKTLGMKLPEEIIIFGIEAREVEQFSEKLTQAVEEALGEVIKRVCELVNE